MLDLIETLFARYGIRSLRYDGRMNREEREIALAEFRQRGGPKVILIRYASHSLSGYKVPILYILMRVLAFGVVASV